MSPAVLKTGDDNEFLGLIEAVDHQVDQLGLDIRMVHQMHQDAIHWAAAGFEVTDGDLQRRQLSLLVVVVDQNGHGQVPDLSLNLFGIMPKNHDNISDVSRFQSRNNLFYKPNAVDGKQRLGSPHATRFSGGKNHSNDHVQIHTPLLVKLINKAVLFELPDNAVIDQIFNPQTRSELAGKSFLDLHFGTFSGHQRHSLVQFRHRRVG